MPFHVSMVPGRLLSIFSKMKNTEYLLWARHCFRHWRYWPHGRNTAQALIGPEDTNGAAETQPRPWQRLKTPTAWQRHGPGPGKACFLKMGATSAVRGKGIAGSTNVYKLRWSRVASWRRQASLCWPLALPGKSSLVRRPSGRYQAEVKEFRLQRCEENGRR